MIQKSSRTAPEWSARIIAFRNSLNLSQTVFGERLNTSAMAVSRWERGQAEPTAAAYLRLGSLAGDPQCWYFWGRAGLSTWDIMRVLPAARHRLRRSKIANVHVVSAGPNETSSLSPKNLVAIPVLPVRAATAEEDTEEVTDLDQLSPESIWAAPAEWCPNPSQTISLRVKGNSMSPLIFDGYIIAVDTSDISRDKLIGQMVVAWNRDTKRLLVSRLLRFEHTDVLVSDQREHQTVSLAGKSKWRIVGRVLWWTGKAR